MDTRLCQMCGALSRLSSGICANCNNVLTVNTATTLTAVMDSVPPAAVAENFDAINAEHVITRLNSVMSAIPSHNASLADQEPILAPVHAGSACSAEDSGAASVLGVALSASTAMVLESALRVIDNASIVSAPASTHPEAALAPANPHLEVVSVEHKEPQVRSQASVGDFFNEAPVPHSRFAEPDQTAVPDPIIQNTIANPTQNSISGALSNAQNSARFVEECKQAVERRLEDAAAVRPSNFINQKSSRIYENEEQNVFGKASLRQRDSGRKNLEPDSTSSTRKIESAEKNEADHFVLKLPKKPAIVAAVILLLIGFFVICGLQKKQSDLNSQPNPVTYSGQASELHSDLPLVNVESKAAKRPSSNRPVLLTHTNFLGEYKIRLAEHSGLASDGSILIESRDGDKFAGQAVINHVQARNLLDNSNGTVRLNTTLSMQNYKVSGTCGNSNVLSLRLIPHNTNFRPMHVDAAAEYNGNRLLLSGSWYPESARFWARPTTRYAFQAVQSKILLPPQSMDLLKLIFWNESDSMQTRFLKILALCFVIGAAIAWTSIKFFSMDGLLSHWERDKYIPNSKVREHKKLLSQLSPSKANVQGSLFLGVRSDWNLLNPLSPKTLHLPPKMRSQNPHTLVLGAGSKGKSRLLATQIVDDIRHGDRAVVVIDSEGSLTDLLLNWAASQPDGKQLSNRIQVIDPCKRESLLGFNPLIATDQHTISSHAASIVMGFKAVYTESQNSQNQWTQQTANILRNALILLILNGRSIADLPLLLSDNDFRDLMLQQIERVHADEWKTLLEAWSNYKKLARSEQWINWIEPILNRVQPLLSEPRLSRLLVERERVVNLENVLANNGVLLVRVPEGQLHKGGNLLGSLIITGLRQAAVQQFENEGSELNPCSIFVDELNNFFDAELFDAVTSETRKLQIGIIGTLRTLQDLSEEFRNRAVLSFGTMALFSIAKKDADILGPTMFRVDGRRVKKWNIKDFFNPGNSTPTTDLVSDEEKFNIDRLLGQPDRSYFCYLVGSQAGVFRMKSREFQDISKDKINWDLLDRIYELKQFSDDEAYESDEQ